VLIRDENAARSNLKKAHKINNLMTKLIKPILPVIALLFVFTVKAQQMELTYEAAVQTALERNIVLKTQENQMDFARAQRAQARGEFGPTVSATLNAWESNGNTFIEQEAKTINTISDNMYGSINTELNLFSGFSQINKLKAYNANFEAQQSLIKRTAQDVVFQVTNQYLQVLLDGELREIAIDNLKTQEVLLTQIDAMVMAGNKPKSDLYDQQAVVKKMELLVLQAGNTLSNDKSKLAITLQFEPTVELEVTDSLWDLDEIVAYTPDVTELYDVSLQNRYDLKQFQQLEVASEKSVAVSKAAFAPSLFAFYNFSTRYNDQSLRNLEDQLIIDNKRMEYGLALNIPIYTGLRNRTNLVRQQVLSENAQLDTENLRKTILNDVRQAYQNFLDVRTGYEVSLAEYAASEQAFNVQKEKYNLGVGSLIELTNANNNFVLAASRNAQARLSLLFQKVILDYHTGVLLAPR
jgi:outer membrane protein